MGPRCKTIKEFFDRWESVLCGIILHGYTVQFDPAKLTSHQILEMQAMDRHHMRVILQDIWDTEICPPKLPVSPMMQRLATAAKRNAT
jgi:hypothetical protein